MFIQFARFSRYNEAIHAERSNLFFSIFSQYLEWKQDRALSVWKDIQKMCCIRKIRKFFADFDERIWSENPKGYQAFWFNRLHVLFVRVIHLFSLAVQAYNWKHVFDRLVYNTVITLTEKKK